MPRAALPPRPVPQPIRHHCSGAKHPRKCGKGAIGKQLPHAVVRRDGNRLSEPQRAIRRNAGRHGARRANACGGGPVLGAGRSRGAKHGNPSNGGCRPRVARCKPPFLGVRREARRRARARASARSGRRAPARAVRAGGALHAAAAARPRGRAAVAGRRSAGPAAGSSGKAPPRANGAPGAGRGNL